MSQKESALYSLTTEMTPKIDENETAFSLRSRDYKDPQCVAYRKQSHPINAMQGQGWEEAEKNDTLNCHDNGESRTPTLIVENHPNDSRVKIRDDGTCQTLSSRMGTGGNNVPMCMENSVNAVVRRLTPLECERLQGFPDGWTDIGEWTDSKGKNHKDADSPRYKALGNSIAIPYWEWLARKVADSLGDKDLTMGSLFDGIGGFPLSFSRAGVKPIWASEIEEFPIAVTKRRFPDEE